MSHGLVHVLDGLSTRVEFVAAAQVPSSARTRSLRPPPEARVDATPTAHRRLRGVVRPREFKRCMNRFVTGR